jgi:hypothetical protein
MAAAPANEAAATSVQARFPTPAFSQARGASRGVMMCLFRFEVSPTAGAKEGTSCPPQPSAGRHSFWEERACRAGGAKTASSTASGGDWSACATP